MAKKEEDQQILRKAGARRWPLPIGNNFKMLKVAKDAEGTNTENACAAAKSKQGLLRMQQSCNQ